MDCTQVLSRYVYFRRDYTFSIYIGYCSSEYEEHIYGSCILFEQWVYAMFCLGCPRAEAAWEIPDGYGSLASLHAGADLAEAIAFHFSWFKEDPEYERKLLGEMELGEPV